MSVRRGGSPGRFTGIVAVGIVLAATLPASAQDLERRIAGVEDGKVRFSFAAREGVCGDGHHGISIRGNGGWWLRRGSEDWLSDCEAGPVRIVLRLVDGRARDLDTYVAGRWRPGSRAVDLGMVPVREAVDYLFGLVKRGPAEVSEDAVLPIVLADSVETWRGLLEVARDESIPLDTRKSTVFWLSHSAGEAVSDGLGAIARDGDEDREVREAAVFALSQRPNEEGVPMLIAIARSHADLEIRKKALFWLGQSGDPRALELFEELLTER